MKRKRKRIKMNSQPGARRRVLLALGWYDYEVNRGVAAFAREANWILNDMAGHTHQFPLHWRCDGILVSLPRTPDPDQAKLLKRGVPVVDLRIEYPHPLPRVVLDNEAIGHIAAEHFLARGFTDYAYYQAYAGQVEEERMAGFRRTVEKAGKIFHHINMTKAPAAFRRGDKRLDYLAALIKELPKPIAVMGQYDGSASEFVVACERAGVPVPEHAAVLGADNDPITSELGIIPLTSVDTDRYRHGYEAAALLDRLMKGEKRTPVVIRIPPKDVVVRRSSSILAVKNLHVSRALSFIWDHYTQPIQVKDVVQAAEISRRSLFALFRQHLGHTVMDEITRLRVILAKKLLRSSDEKTYAVARSCGFTDARHLNKSFQRATGMTPTDFREKA